MILEKRREKVNGKARSKGENHARRHAASRSKSYNKSSRPEAFTSSSSTASYGSAGHQHAPIQSRNSSPIVHHDFQQVITSNNQTFLSKYGVFNRVSEFPMPATQVVEPSFQHTVDTLAKNKKHDFQQNVAISHINEIIDNVVERTVPLHMDINYGLTTNSASESGHSLTTPTTTNVETTINETAAVETNNGSGTRLPSIQCEVSDISTNNIALDSVDHIRYEVANISDTSSLSATSSPEDAEITREKAAARSILKKHHAPLNVMNSSMAQTAVAKLEHMQDDNLPASGSQKTSKKNVRFASQLCEVTSYTLAPDYEEVQSDVGQDETPTRNSSSKENGSGLNVASFGRVIRPSSALHLTLEKQPHAPRSLAPQISNTFENEANAPMVVEVANVNGDSADSERTRQQPTIVCNMNGGNVVSNIFSRGASALLPSEISVGVGQFGPHVAISDRFVLAQNHHTSVSFTSNEAANCTPTTPTNSSHGKTFFQQPQQKHLTLHHPPPQESRGTLLSNDENEEFNLQKTPTDQEIDWLWEKVRSCLNRKGFGHHEAVQENSELSTPTSSTRTSVPMSAQLIDGTSLLPTSRIYQTRVGGHGVRVVHHLVSTHQRRVALLRHREQAITPNVAGRFRNSVTSATQRDATKKENVSEAASTAVSAPPTPRIMLKTVPFTFVTKHTNDNLSTEQNYHYNVSQNAESTATASISSSMPLSPGSNEVPSSSSSSTFASSRRGVMLKARQQTQPPFLNLYSPHPPNVLSPRQRLFSASSKIRSNSMMTTQFLIDESWLASTKN